MTTEGRLAEVAISATLAEGPTMALTVGEKTAEAEVAAGGETMVTKAKD